MALITRWCRAVLEQLSLRRQRDVYVELLRLDARTLRDIGLERRDMA